MSIYVSGRSRQQNYEITLQRGRLQVIGQRLLGIKIDLATRQGLIYLTIIMSGDGTSIGYRYLTREPGVRSSRAIIEGTRIGVHDVIGLLQNGESLDTIVTRCYPNISRAQVYECLAYYEDHRGEIDVLVARQMSAPTQMTA